MRLEREEMEVKITKLERKDQEKEGNREKRIEMEG